MALSPAELYALARKAGFDPAQSVIAAAIALAESGGRPEAIGDPNLLGKGSGSYGIFQINYVPSRDKKVLYRDPASNLDPLTAAKNAYKISNSGKNFKPWTVYKTGRYKDFLPRVNKAIENLPDAPKLPDATTVDAAKPALPFRPAGGKFTFNIDPKTTEELAKKSPPGPNVFGGIEKFIFSTIFVIAGLGLIVLGVARTTGVESTIKSTLTKAAP